MYKKITVTIENSSNLLRLRWNDGRRRSLALGLRDTPSNRSLATSIKNKIEQDCCNGTYDKSLLRYKPQITGSNATDITAPELFQRFTNHKLKIGDISEHTASICYKHIRTVLERQLNKNVSAIDRKEAEALAQHFAQTITPHVAKARLGLLKSCWSWAVGNYQVVDENPWQGLTTRFKPIDKKLIEPFTRQEVAVIIQGFRDSQRHYHYTDFVTFQFGVGTRIGEAVALKWDSVKPDFSSVWIGESTTKEFKNPTTKTGKARHVILSPMIAAMLKTRKEARRSKPTDLVFPALDGGSIYCNLFGSYWSTVLSRVNVPYRKFYSTRHTAISHALENGANPLDVAAQCGHDVKTLFDCYAHVIQRKQVFIEF
jgi:integrase